MSCNIEKIITLVTMKKTIVFFAAAFTAAMLSASCGRNGGQTESASSDNPVIEAIMARRSIRKYQDRPVEREKLQLIAECGVNAPNGSNAQRWEVRIVDDAAKIDAISGAFKLANPDMVARDPGFKNMFRNAPAVIFVAVPEGDDGVNAGLLGENIMLSAYSVGLGTICLGGPVNFLKNSPDGRAFLSTLGFSEGYELIYAIGVGYPDESPEARPRDLSKIRFVD